MTARNTAQDVLTFWFGDYAAMPPALADEPDHLEATASAFAPLWFKKSQATDDSIRDQFVHLLAPGALPLLQSWRTTPLGRVASLVVVDQFSRNMFRGESRAFATDALAQNWALESLAMGDHQQLGALLQVFMYLPLEHAEDLSLQNLCVHLFEDLQAKHPHSAAMANYAEFARKHQVVIERFGRFVHRNAILNRTSTAEELAFLQQPGSSF
jgi:uncharacterized protein (DUF924 family)